MKKFISALIILLILGSTPTIAATPKPDLIVDTQWDVNNGTDVRVVTETFDPLDCAVQEGAISAGTHRLLRFGTKTDNVGSVDLRIGTPKKNSADWEFFTCHNHWHFLKYAQYDLLDTAGNVVGVGHKQSFCIEDSYHDSGIGSTSPRYNCEHQGMSVGWSDIYDSSLPGQWIIIDGLASGNYTLKIIVNYANVLPETNYNNNTALVSVTIP